VNQFKLFNVWDIVPSCEFSNHFWWFGISKHMISLLCKFYVLCKKKKFAHSFVCSDFPFYVLLEFLLIIRESYFEFKYDALVKMFLCYFVWCVDNDRCRCWYGSAQQPPWCPKLIHLRNLCILVFYTSLTNKNFLLQQMLSMLNLSSK
jgi:hypothetical protein